MTIRDDIQTAPRSMQLTNLIQPAAGILPENHSCEFQWHGSLKSLTGLVPHTVIDHP